MHRQFSFHLASQQEHFHDTEEFELDEERPKVPYQSLKREGRREEEVPKTVRWIRLGQRKIRELEQKTQRDETSMILKGILDEESKPKEPQSTIKGQLAIQTQQLVNNLMTAVEKIINENIPPGDVQEDGDDKKESKHTKDHRRKKERGHYRQGTFSQNPLLYEEFEGISPIHTHSKIISILNNSLEQPKPRRRILQHKNAN